MLLRFWHHWNIGRRLLLITLLPVACLFCLLVWHSYWSHAREADLEIDERGRLISQLLAKSSEYPLATNRLPELKLSLDNLIQSDRGIVSIDILGPDRKPLLHREAAEKNQQRLRGFETPIVKRLIWVNVVSDNGSIDDATRSGSSTQIAGYVRVVMSPGALQAKQQHRFALELLVAALGLLISAALAVQLSQSLSASFKTFIDACRAIRNGRYPVHIAVSDGGEIGELQTSINAMAASLQQSTEELENKVAQRTRELESSRNEALKANDDKRKLIHKAQHIVEEERRSIAAEIHDELNAALITARLQAQRIVELSEALTQESAAQEIRQHALSIKQTARSLYDNGRALVRRLRPEVLDMLGLQGAIEEMTDSYNKLQPSCRFDCVIRGDFSTLDNAVAMSLYRIVQEALSNVIKHAGARHAEVRLSLDQASCEVRLQVSDDGKGFVQNHATDGIGLVGIRERVFSLNGTIEIESGQSGQRGTTMTITLKV